MNICLDDYHDLELKTKPRPRSKRNILKEIECREEDQTPVERRIKKFKKWLKDRGAEVLSTTNQWELVRFKSGSETSIIYTSKTGKLTFTGEAKTAFDNYKYCGPWRAMKATKRKPTNKSPELRTLLDRDGDLCFYCQEKMPDDDMSREHLLSLVHGGSYHMSNIVLAHRKCNNDAGSLSVMEKINIHIQAKLRNKSKLEGKNVTP